MKMKKILFICNYNRFRSPTAQKIFSDSPHLEVKSAGIFPHAIVQVSEELLEWADIIFVMEYSQTKYINKHFIGISERRPVICLNIEDEYNYMDPELVDLLKQRVTPHIVVPLLTVTRRKT